MNVPEQYPTSYTTKYQEKYCQMLIDYFRVDSNENLVDADGNEVIGKYGPIPRPVSCRTEAGFCKLIGISKETFKRWVDKKVNFREAYRQAKTFEEAIITENAMIGAYNAQFAMFYAKCKLGWRDGSEEDQKAPPVSITYEVVDARVRDKPE